MPLINPLWARGFAPDEAASLLDLRARYELGEFRELTDDEKRFDFVRWLVKRGRLNEGQVSRNAPSAARVGVLALLTRRLTRR